MSRRSVPPRGRKTRNPNSIVPPGDAAAASVAPPPPQPVVEVRHRPAAPLDEAAAVDAGWDELLG